MNRRHLVLGGVALFASLAGMLATARPAGPGMTLGFNSDMTNTCVHIDGARLPDGTAFSVPAIVDGTGKGNEDPLVGMSVMGASPDGRELPEYVDFKWREEPLPQPLDPAPMTRLPRLTRHGWPSGWSS